MNLCRCHIKLTCFVQPALSTRTLPGHLWTIGLNPSPLPNALFQEYTNPEPISKYTNQSTTWPEHYELHVCPKLNCLSASLGINGRMQMSTRSRQAFEKLHFTQYETYIPLTWLMARRFSCRCSFRPAHKTNGRIVGLCSLTGYLLPASLFIGFGSVTTTRTLPERRFEALLL